MNRFLSGLALIPVSVMITHPVIRAQDYATNLEPMLVDGRITDGENKLPGAEVVLFRGNEIMATTKTDKGGRFGFKLDMNADYAMEFRQEGFVPKRIAIDTRLPKPRPGQEYELVPLDITISLLEKERYNGAPTDDLDFPFALIKFNKKTLTFEQDVEYTMGMQRTNGALLLMAARSEKR